MFVLNSYSIPDSVFLLVGVWVDDWGVGYSGLSWECSKLRQYVGMPDMVKFSVWLGCMNFNLALTQALSSPSYFFLSSSSSCFPSYSFTDSFTQTSLRLSEHMGLWWWRDKNWFECDTGWMATACCICLFCDESVMQEHDCQCMLYILEYFSYMTLSVFWICFHSVNTTLQIMNTYITIELRMPLNIPGALRD